MSVRAEGQCGDTGLIGRRGDREFLGVGGITDVPQPHSRLALLTGGRGDQPSVRAQGDRADARELDAAFAGARRAPQRDRVPGRDGQAAPVRALGQVRRPVLAVEDAVRSHRGEQRGPVCLRVEPVRRHSKLLGQAGLAVTQVGGFGRDQLGHRVLLLGAGFLLEGEGQTTAAHRQQGQHDQGRDRRPPAPDPAPLVPLRAVEELGQP